MSKKIVQGSDGPVQWSSSYFTLCLDIAPKIINKSNNHKNNNNNNNNNNNDNDNNNNNNNNKRVPSMRVFSSTLALHLQLVPLCDNFHAFDEALIFQKQTFRSFCQRSAYLIELRLWVNQKILRSFYKFSKFNMKTSGDYLSNSFVLGHVADVGFCIPTYSREFKKPQLQRQRERH